MFKFYIRKLLLLGETDPHSNLGDWMQHLYICEEISWTLSRKTARQTACSLLIIPEWPRSRNQLRFQKAPGRSVGCVCIYLHNPSALLFCFFFVWMVVFYACLAFEIQTNKRDEFIKRTDALNKPDWNHHCLWRKFMEQLSDGNDFQSSLRLNPRLWIG